MEDYAKLSPCIMITYTIAHAVGKATIANGGFEMAEHAPHLPDLTPSDYQLFPKLKEHLCGKRFSSDNHISKRLENALTLTETVLKNVCNIVVDTLGVE